MIPAAPLGTRAVRPELMDSPELEPERLQEAIRGLDRLHRASGSARLLWRPLAELARARGPLRVLDVACGAGELARALERRARRARLDVRIDGCDLNPRAVLLARTRGMRTEASFSVRDVVAEPLPGGYHVVYTSLFLHHLDDGRAAALLAAMGAAASRAVLVHDLVRSRVGWAYAWLGSRLLQRSEVVRFDALRSVENGFAPDELRRIAERAGLAGARVERRFPERLLLDWRRPARPRGPRVP